MSNLGIYIEYKNNNFKKSNKEVLTFARKSNRDTYAIVFADDISEIKNELSGIKKVVQIKTNGNGYQPDIYAQTLSSIIKEYELKDFIGINSATLKDLIPRVSAKIDATLINDCLSIDLDNSKVTKPVYAGKLLCDYKVNDEYKIYLMRPNVYSAEDAQGDEPEVIEKALEDTEIKTNIVEVIQSESKKIDLTEAEIIVSGGRAMKSQENFKILEELANVLNAGVGASRAAVDAGYATSDMQVGQTGKVVNPKLYIACGISGAIQHFVGMKTSKVIVAINTDPEAPIFKKADYGIVGDLFKVVPLLTEELKKNL